MSDLNIFFLTFYTALNTWKGNKSIGFKSRLTVNKHSSNRNVSTIIWRYEMETFSVLLTLLWGDTTSHRWITLTKSSNVGFHVFFNVSLNKRSNKQLIYVWFETPWCSLWCHCNETFVFLCAQIAKFMGTTWGPPGSCRPQMGRMLAPWTLLSGCVRLVTAITLSGCGACPRPYN